MHASLRARLSRLEKLRPANPGPAVIVIYGAAHNDNEIIGISGLNLPRFADEVTAHYLERIQDYARQLRGNRMPMVCIAEYAGDT